MVIRYYFKLIMNKDGLIAMTKFISMCDIIKMQSNEINKKVPTNQTKSKYHFTQVATIQGSVSIWLVL